MRNLSFALTTDQVRNQTKTVTRRIGWAWLTPGTMLQPIVKGQGIPKGAKVEKIGAPIRVVAVRRERLNAIIQLVGYTFEQAQREMVAEGFPEMSPVSFVEMFCATHKIPDTRIGPPRGRYRQPFPMLPNDEVTRIEFEYTEAGR